MQKVFVLLKTISMLQEDNILASQKNSIVGLSLEAEVLTWTCILELLDPGGLQKEIK